MSSLRREALPSGPVLEEQRSTSRQPTHTDLSFSIKRVVGQFTGQPQGEGTFINISEGGILFSTQHKLGRGSIIVLSEENDRNQFQGDTLRILRCEKSANEYEIAAEFIA